MTSSVGKGDVDIIIAILQQQYVERYFYHTEKYIAVALAVAFPVVGNTHSGTINLYHRFLGSRDRTAYRHTQACSARTGLDSCEGERKG